MILVEENIQQILFICLAAWFNGYIVDIMEMIIHLDSDVFETVDKGFKNVEGRVNDEKRRKLKIGDTLIFLKRPLDDEEIKAKVVDLKYYNDFSSLVDDLEMKRIYLENYTKEMYLKEMERFYSIEEQQNYGVVAIVFKKE